VDIDPQALESAAQRRNHCSATYYLPEPFAAAHPEGERFDVVVPTSWPALQLMAPMLAGRVRAGGALVLSGVLDRQAGKSSPPTRPGSP
jgi:ribosomal protein L11 methyltransferase